MINWPAIIKHSNDPELMFVSSQTEWENDVDIQCFEYEAEDYLVDSYGKIYTLNGKVNSCINPEPSGDSKSLKEILGLVKDHAAQQGSCCVAKLYAPSITEAFKIIESLYET